MTAQDYRDQSEKLRRQAARAKDGAVREQLLLMAGDWEKLAEEAERLQAQRSSQAG